MGTGSESSRCLSPLFYPIILSVQTMASTFHHEALYRGAAALGKLAEVRVTLCGAGGLGSHLADNLARQGFQHLRVIDRDRVEEHNVSTQLYGTSDIGAWKVEVLRQRLSAPLASKSTWNERS